MTIKNLAKKPLFYNWAGFVVLFLGLLGASPLLADWQQLAFLKLGSPHWWYIFLSSLIVGALVIFGVLPCSRFGPPPKVGEPKHAAAPSQPRPSKEG